MDMGASASRGMLVCSPAFAGSPEDDTLCWCGYTLAAGRIWTRDRPHSGKSGTSFTGT